MNEKRSLALAAGAALGITVLFFFLLVRPKLAEIADTQTQLATAQAEESRLRAEIKRLEAIRLDAPATIAKLTRISQYLPSTPDLPAFIRSVQAASTAAGVDLFSIAPSQPGALTGSTGIETITVTLVANGSFARMQDLMSRLESLPRIVQTTAFSFSPQVDELSGEASLSSTISLTMYVVQANATLKSVPAATPSATPTPGAS